MLVFGFSILQVGGTHTRIVHVRVSFVLYKEKKKKRDESENKHGNGKRMWLGAELNWIP